MDKGLLKVLVWISLGVGLVLLWIMVLVWIYLGVGLVLYLMDRVQDRVLYK
jgi:hypothetical protein